MLNVPFAWIATLLSYFQPMPSTYTTRRHEDQCAADRDYRGIGTLIGPAIGAALYTLVGNVLQTQFAQWQLVFGIVCILLVLFLSFGLAGTWRRRQRRSVRQIARRFAADSLPTAPPNGDPEAGAGHASPSMKKRRERCTGVAVGLLP
jgi:hypothetical protein